MALTRTMKKLGMLSAYLLLLTSCYVSIHDGKVPADYLESAKKLVGLYHGQFEGRQMELSLTLQQDGTARLVARDLNGNTELINGCHSNIGQLIGADVDKNQKTLNYILFSLDHGTCKIAGHDVGLEFEQGGGLQVEVVATTKIVHRPGDWICTGNGSHEHCHSTPGTWETVPDKILTGSFNKN